MNVATNRGGSKTEHPCCDSGAGMASTDVHGAKIFRFTKNAQVPARMRDILQTTLDEVEAGEVAGVTVIISRPDDHSSEGGICIRYAFEDRIKHVGALTLAIHDMVGRE